jgi:hypothetical protein
VPLALRSCSEEVETALCDWSRAAAKEVLAELWEADVERLCGERWKPRPRSKVTRAGWCKSDITLGRQRVEVRRPRVRSVQGKEIELPTFKAASRRDLLDRSALEDVTASVTTGSFPRDRFPRERIPEEFVDQLASRLGAEHAVPKGAFDTGLLIAPIDFPDQSFLGAVGIDASARRRIVGLRAGAVDSEENVRGLVDEVIARHSGQAPPAVFIVGEVPMLVTALTERFGRSILIQRPRMRRQRSAPCRRLSARSRLLIQGPRMPCATRSTTRSRCKDSGWQSRTGAPTLGSRPFRPRPERHRPPDRGARR